MKKYFDSVLDAAGNAISGAQVLVYNYGTTTNASIFSDAGGTVSLTNPLTTSSTGFFEFYAADGRYTLSIAAAAFSGAIITDILLDDPLDILTYVDTGIVASFASDIAGYNQVVIQNKSNTASASANFIVAKSDTTSSTGYGEFGINSPSFTGAGPFSLPNVTYINSVGQDLVVGTGTAHSLRFGTNGTEWVSIGSTGAVQIASTAQNVLTTKSDAASTFAIQNFWGNQVTGDVLFTRFATDANTKRGEIIYDRANDVVRFSGSNVTQIGFNTNGVERVRIDASGNFGLGITPTARNNTRLQIIDGIGFPATQVASTDPNTLDDYEEGTWTPTQGAGLTVVGGFSSSGTYTKIGRQVTLTGQINGATSVAAAAGAIMVGGMPFSSIAPGSSGFAANAVATASSVLAGATASASIYACTAIAATPSISFCITYFVA